MKIDVNRFIENTLSRIAAGLAIIAITWFANKGLKFIGWDLIPVRTENVRVVKDVLWALDQGKLIEKPERQETGLKMEAHSPAESPKKEK